MAQRSTIHRVSIELSDTDRQVYESIQMSVARADSETPQRLIARLLAYCLCYERDIEFTGGVGAGEEPDVWVREPDGRVKVWIEVGIPDPKRLLKAARHCQRVVLLTYGRRPRDWDGDALPQFEKAGNITMAELDRSLHERLVERLDRTVAWELTVSGGTLYLTVGKEQLEGTVTPVVGPGLAD